MEKKVIKARDVMRSNFSEIDGMATVNDAVHVFSNSSVDMLVVKKRDEHDAHGVVLLSDVVKKVLARDRSVNRVNVYEIMSKPAISIEPNMDVRYCARLFDRFGLSHAIVTEGGMVKGIVGYRELLGPWMAQEKEE